MSEQEGFDAHAVGNTVMERRNEMTTRTFYVPRVDGIGVTTGVSPAFEWFGGCALSQAQRCVRSLHAAIAAERPGARILDTTSKSTDAFGVGLSAMNLTWDRPEGPCCLESVYQGSKVFADGFGPRPDLYAKPGRETRKTVKARASEIVGYEMDGLTWPVSNGPAFFFYAALNALKCHPDYVSRLMSYDVFTDITFNPKKATNCTAQAVAYFVSVVGSNRINEVMDELRSGRIIGSLDRI